MAFSTKDLAAAVAANGKIDALRAEVLATGVLNRTPAPTPPPAAATAFTTSLSSSSSTVGNAVTLTGTPTGAAWPSGVALTPAAAGLSGTFAPTTRTPSGTTAATFDFTPSAAGSGTISVSTSPSMTAPAGLAYQATAVASSTPTPSPTPAPTPTPTPAPTPAPTPTPTPTPTAPPGQVTGLTLSVTSSSISASWSAPTSGAAVTAYKQQYRAVGSATWNTRTSNVTGRAFDLQANFYMGVSPDTDYEVVITAIAAGVEGAPSATVATHTLAVPAPPGPTTALTAGSITSTSVFLSWTAPTSGGVPNGYQVEDRTPPGSGAWVDPLAIGGAVSCTKTGLSPSTTYEFHVFAYNDGGSGEPSASITITTAA